MAKKLIAGMLVLGILALILAACSSAQAQGKIQVNVTDALPKGVTAVVIKAANIEAHKADASDDQWVSLLKDPPAFDLVKVSGVNYALGTAQVAAGTYTQIRLDITKVTVTIDGKQVDAIVPSDKLRLVGDFTVQEGQETSISLDFDGERSVVLEGNNRVSLKPVVRLIVAQPGEKLPTPVPGTPIGTPTQSTSTPATTQPAA